MIVVTRSWHLDSSRQPSSPRTQLQSPDRCPPLTTPGRRYVAPTAHQSQLRRANADDTKCLRRRNVISVKMPVGRKVGAQAAGDGHGELHVRRVDALQSRRECHEHENVVWAPPCRLLLLSAQLSSNRRPTSPRSASLRTRLPPTTCLCAGSTLALQAGSEAPNDEAVPRDTTSIPQRQEVNTERGACGRPSP